tara:strand:+ start:35 stop:673 length:639 start_codon:yes stop_codon:yes gene_type:complete
MIGGIGGDEGYVDPVPGWAFDYRLNGNDTNLTPINSPTIVTGIELPDKLASEFNGVGQYYTSSDLALTGVGTGAFSIVARFRTTSSISKVLISTGNGADATTFRLRITGTGFVQMRINGNLVSVSGGLNDGDWHQVICTYSGSGGDARLYIDGALETSATSPVYNLSGTGALQVASQGGAALFDGDMDGIRFYDLIVLTPAEVILLNNNVGV